MSKKLVLSTEEKELIVSMYQSGSLLYDIEKAIGHCDKFIYETLDEYGIERNRKTKKITEEQLQSIIEFHKEGLSYDQISEKLGGYISSSKIYELLKENGETNSFSIDKINSIIDAQNKDNHRKYYFDEHMLDVINTPDKAYCVGLFMADGCNQLNSGCFSIGLQARDKDILEKISQMFQSDYPLKFRDSSKYEYMAQDVYTIRWNSKYFCERLNEIGIIPNKSLVLDFPYWLERHLIPYLIKGYIDGDGWINKNQIGFMSTEKFCIGVQEYLNSIGISSYIMDMKKHYKEDTKELLISGRNNIWPLARIMFSHGNLYLNRKYQKYIDYKFIDVNSSLK